MSNREEILTPIGRLVGGSLYEPQTKDFDGRPLVTKTGQPRVNYYLALAIPKGAEKHWAETPWGAVIWRVGHAGFGTKADSPTFAWKIVDGDSNIPNGNDNKPCDNEGFPGHWILRFSGGFAPSVHNEDGTKQITEVDAVKPGDYIQIYGSVADNGSAQQAGVFLNHSMVAFHYYGKRIIIGADPKAVGFGNPSGVMPVGASKIPLNQGFHPASAPTANATQNSYTPPPVQPPVNSAPPAVTPPPHYGILNPPSPPSAQPPAPVRVMLPPSNGATYEQMIAVGWTDADLIKHGMMQG